MRKHLITLAFAFPIAHALDLLAKIANYRNESYQYIISILVSVCIYVACKFIVDSLTQLNK